MGTLTGDVTRLPGFCEHKLPTSCRLTSIPNCCACADERAHAPSYSTYIDGIGFVPRGNRWQRYCWFCKEFWAHRVSVSGLRPAQTRIPEVPDQSEFLERWYEFHRGYRIVQKEDGREEHVAVLGEDFRDVSPGHLPRTLEELRAGREHAREVQSPQATQQQSVESSGPSIEDTLEQMCEDVAAEDTSARAVVTSSQSHDSAVPQEPAIPLEQSVTGRELPLRSNSNVHAQVMNSAPSRNREYQMRRVAALRRELNRMRNGIERVICGLRDLGEDIPDHTNATNNLAALDTRLDTVGGPPPQIEADEALASLNALVATSRGRSGDQSSEEMQARLDNARAGVEETRRLRDLAASELEVAESEFRAAQQRWQQLTREQRTAENYMRLFGTREEMTAQGDNYESPIGGMFSRAYDRFRVAEEARVEERTLREVLAAEAAAGGEIEAQRLAELENRERDVWGVPRPGSRPNTSSRRFAASNVGRIDMNMPAHLMATDDEATLQEYYALLRRQDQPPDTFPDGGVADGQRMLATEGDIAAELPGDNFPNSMLHAIRSVRQRELEEQDLLHIPGSSVGRPSTAEPLHHLMREEWWRQDVEHVLRHVSSDEALRNELGWTLQAIDSSRFWNDMLPEPDRAALNELLQNGKVIWTTRLPEEWLRRRRNDVADRLNEGQTGPSLTGQLLFSDSEADPTAQEWEQHHNYYLTFEIIAQAFQMSAEVRRCASELTPMERLQTLYRFQEGQRLERDIDVLQSIYRVPDSYLLAMSVFQRTLAHNDEAEQATVRLQAGIDESRRAMARDGNHSRAELDSRRHDAANINALALAAGRQAMQTGSDSVMARLSSSGDFDRDLEGTRAAMRRLQSNSSRSRPARVYRQLTLSDYRNEASSESESENNEDAEARGLDTPESGRPEPKTDEELKVQMECKVVQRSALTMLTARSDQAAARSSMPSVPPWDPFETPGLPSLSWSSSVYV